VNPYALALLAALAIGGLLLLGAAIYRRAERARLAERDGGGERRGGEQDPVAVVHGFTGRVEARLSQFMRRVAVALIVLTALITVSLAVNVLLWGKSRIDDRQQTALSHTNARIIARLNRELIDRRSRAAATDRQQCVDIERLKANARKSGRQGEKTIKALTGLPEKDKAALIAANRRSLKLFKSRVVVTAGGIRLRGVAACSHLPNADPGRAG
jgi:hypothetical protein